MSYLEIFVRASDRVIEFHQYFVSLPETEHTIHKLEIQKDANVHQWRTLRSAYDILLSKLESQEREVDLESIRGKFYAAYHAHLNCLSHANELVDKFKSQAIPVAGVVRTNPNPNITVPTCDCDVFHGDYVSWPTFRDKSISQQYTSEDRKNRRVLIKSKIINGP